MDTCSDNRRLNLRYAACLDVEGSEVAGKKKTKSGPPVPTFQKCYINVPTYIYVPYTHFQRGFFNAGGGGGETVRDVRTLEIPQKKNHHVFLKRGRGKKERRIMKGTQFPLGKQVVFSSVSCCERPPAFREEVPTSLFFFD